MEQYILTRLKFKQKFAQFDTIWEKNPKEANVYLVEKNKK